MLNRRVAAGLAAGTFSLGSLGAVAAPAQAEERFVQANIQGFAGDHWGNPVYANDLIGQWNYQNSIGFPPGVVSANEVCVRQKDALINYANAFNVNQGEASKYRVDFVITKTQFSQSQLSDSRNVCYWTDSKGTRFYEYGNAMATRTQLGGGTVGPVTYAQQQAGSTEQRKLFCRQRVLAQPKYFACTTHLAPVSSGITYDQAVQANTLTVGLGLSTGPGVMLMGDLNLSRGFVSSALPFRPDVDECPGGPINFPTFGSEKIDYILTLKNGTPTFSCAGDGWVFDGGQSDHDFLVGRLNFQ